MLKNRQKFGLIKKTTGLITGLLLLAHPVVLAQYSLDWLEDQGAEKAKNTVTIGVVQDGQSDFSRALWKKIQTELEALVKKRVVLDYDIHNRFVGPWQRQGVKNELRSVLADPDIDIVVTNGIMVSNIAAKDTDLSVTKPVVSSFLLKQDVVTPRTGLLKNKNESKISLIALSSSLSRDFEMMREMFGTSRFHVVLDEALLKGIPDIQQFFQQYAKTASLDIQFLSYTPGKPLAIDASVQAAYLLVPFRETPAQRVAMIEQLNAAKVPTFSYLGKSDIEQGALATLTPIALDRMARRVASNLYRIIVLEESIPSMPTALPVNEELLINAYTAKEIDYFPPLGILQTATMVNKESLEQGRPLSLEQSMRMARRQNVKVAIQQASTDVSKQDRNQNITRLLPQANGSYRFQALNEDQATGRFSPERSNEITAEIEQILYDDEVVSDLRTTQKLFKGERFSLKSEQLDAMELAGKQFIDYLRNRKLLKIEYENLNLTRKNLQLSKLRVAIGSEGKEDVYRWESEEATQKGLVRSQEAAVNNALVALNQTLGLSDQQEYWIPEPLEVNFAPQTAANKPVYSMTTSAIKPTGLSRIQLDGQSRIFPEGIMTLVQNEADYKAFQKFVVALGLEESPEIKAFQEFVKGENIQVGKALRRLFIPKFTADLTLSRRFGLSGVNSSGALADNLENQVTLGINAVYPLFEGGRRLVDISRAKSVVEERKQELEQIEQLVEQAVLNATYNIQNSYSNTNFRQIAVDRANKNLKLVTDRYSQGTVDIIRLIDAQEQTIDERRSYTNAYYDFLDDLIELQRAVSWFEMDKTPDEKLAFYDQFEVVRASYNLSGN
ncbi:MAG: TolC family protein [Cyanobacteria bacterium P01_H01_bin.74]